MPGRLGIRPTRPAGPVPFSSQWLATNVPPEPPPTRIRFPEWLPDGRTLSAGLMVLVTLAVAILSLQSGPRDLAFEQAGPDAAVRPASQPTLAADDLAGAPGLALEPENLAVTLDPTAPADPDEAMAGAPSLPGETTGLVVSPPSEGPLLPAYRIVTYYGHPHDPAMGIVGEHAMQDLAALIRAEAENYAAADPSRPVIPAFELIATVAQGVPVADGTYILDTDKQTLRSYIDFAAAEGMLVVLDLQIGRGSVATDFEKVRDLLALPNVHLALDPEFAVGEGEVPGEYIGSVPAESIAWAQQELAEISAANGIPPKILVVHQFREDMIAGKERLAPVPGVQLVIDADGYGVPELKTAVYNFLVRDQPVEFAGVKIFYRQDVPVMTPQEILALVPPPDVIIYQ